MAVNLIVPIVSGATGSLVTLFTTKGADWLISLVASHSAAVQAKVQANTQNFIQRLAKRVERLEAEIPASAAHIIGEAFDHPETSLLMQKSLLAAAVTDNDDRHSILSELIAQRLTAGADDMIALAGAVACDIVGSLSSRQIHLLALLTTLVQLRPGDPLPDFPAERLGELVPEYWDMHLARVCVADLDKVIPLDFSHLEAVSCIRMDTMVERNLQYTLNITFRGKLIVAPMHVLREMEWWPRMHRLWEMGIRQSTGTTVGYLIGTLHHDSLVGSRTEFNWGNP
jgi:hypothetical protein